jgi:hypothetical protein
MQFLILAALLAVMQTSPSLSRQAAKTGGQHEQTVSKGSPASVEADTHGPTKANSAQQHPDNADHTVGISKLPPVSVTKDWADWGVWVFSLLLVAVGLLQVLLLWRTLGAIQRQADSLGRQVDLTFGQLRAMHEQITEMSSQTDVLERSVKAAQDSADLAKQSANMAVRVAIPTLVIDKFEQANTGAASLEATIQFPNVRIVLKNYGQTPALLRSWNIVFTCEELPLTPDYWNQPGHPEVKPTAAGIVLQKDVIQPNQPYTIPDLHSWQRTELSPEDIQAVITRKKTLWAYGFICYDDLFGSPLRRMKFCEMALNFWTGGVHWVSGFSPETYLGTDDYPYRKSATGNRAEGQTLNTNRKTDEHPEKAN